PPGPPGPGPGPPGPGGGGWGGGAGGPPCPAGDLTMYVQVLPTARGKYSVSPTRSSAEKQPTPRNSRAAGKSNGTRRFMVQIPAGRELRRRAARSFRDRRRGGLAARAFLNDIRFVDHFPPPTPRKLLPAHAPLRLPLQRRAARRVPLRRQRQPLRVAVLRR